MLMNVEAAQTLGQRAMQAAGYSAKDAALIADHLIDCELRGLSFGGLARGLSVIERLQATATPRKAVTVLRDSPVSATLDGGDEVGYLVASRVTDLAIEKARSSGIAVVGANQTWYTGMFSYYLERVTAAGFVGMVAGSGGHLVAPHGASEARFGTNPIAFGFPSTTQPVIWDIGTAELMLGEVLLAHRLGGQLPEGRAFDRDGRPTRTPMDVLGGAVTVWGGHKGSGLALVVQLLGMLAGASAAPDGLTDCGFLMLVVDPGLLTDGDDFRRRVTEYAESVRGARPVDPDRPVRMPFDRSATDRARRLASDELEISDEVCHALRAVIDAHPEHLRNSSGTALTAGEHDR